MPETYNPGQFKVIYKFLPEWCQTPQWLILGGPSCGDEAQTARLKYPEIKVVACEPSAHHYRWQYVVGCIPVFNKVTNRVDVIFNGMEPITE